MPASELPQLFQDLLTAEPQLARLRAEHIADNDEVLPHLLMSDVTRWLITHGPVGAVLAVLEDHFARGGPAVRDVLLASFLENLEADEPAHDRIRAALGPRLRAALVWHSQDRHLGPPI
jgi:hypothetical protein